jgi:DNA mismatch endonuclease, patch repair protein
MDTVRSIPVASSEAVRVRFQRQKIRDTAPELALRKELHRRGLRYRVDVPLLGTRRGRADIVFSRARVVVMVDGCFWHRCPQHGLDPKANSAWWRQKLDRNVERDRRADAELVSSGWRVIRVWEHEAPALAADHIEAAVRRTAEKAGDAR